eukprot:gene9378-6597_t
MSCSLPSRVAVDLPFVSFAVVYVFMWLGGVGVYEPTRDEAGRKRRPSREENRCGAHDWMSLSVEPFSFSFLMLMLALVVDLGRPNPSAL